LDAQPVSVVVVGWNGLEMTNRCLDSLSGQQDVALETVVVDNGSTDGSAGALAGRNDITLIANPDNRGFSRAANQGIRATTSPWVLLLNNDTVLEDPTTLARTVAFAASHPDAGAVGVKLRNEDGSLQISCARFHTLWAEVRNSLPLRVVLGPREDLLRYSAQDHDRTGPVDWVMGAFLLCPREALERLRGLDESEFMYGEDYDLCYRLRGLGLRTYYLADVAVTHVGNAAGAQRYTAEDRLVRVTRVERHLLSRHRGRAYGWAYAWLTTLDRWTKLLAARAMGDRARAENLRREVRVRRRALRGR
jgi:GT2 family glycosyltransferase